jgi:endoglucanase
MYLFVFDLKAHLRTLVEAHAPSGHEAPIRAILRDAWGGWVDEFQEDKLGSLIAIKRATRKTDPPRKIMLAAHMDEIGMMVTRLVDGFIGFLPVAGTDNRLLLAQPVLVHARETLRGVVSTVPPHLLKNGASKYVEFPALLIDVGLPQSEVERLVQPGDLITLEAPMLELNSHRVAGKAMDDRACVAAVTVCLKELQKYHHSWDVYATATVQEETGLYGAKTAAYSIAPDIAIALDVAFAKQPSVNDDKTIEMNGGPGIGVGPNFHPKLYDKLRETAKALEMKLQDDLLTGNSGTDAWSIQVSQMGVPTALLEVPIRSMHSPVETADLRDIERVGRLMAAFIADLTPDFMTALAWETLKTQEAAS